MSLTRAVIRAVTGQVKGIFQLLRHSVPDGMAILQVRSPEAPPGHHG